MSGEQHDWRDMVSSAMTFASAAETKADDAKSMVASVQVAWSASGTITHTATVAVSLAVRVVEIAVPEARAGDTVQVHEASSNRINGVDVAVGVILQSHATVLKAGKVPAKHMIPALSIGQTLTIPLILRGYRPAA